MTRTQTKPLDDKNIWRRTFARTHPDAGGDHDHLFIWVQAVRDAMYAGGNTAEHHPPRRQHRAEPSPRPEPRIVYEDGRVPFPESAPFEALTRWALTTTYEVLRLYADLLRMLEDCELVDYEPLYEQERRGATYKQLAAIGYRAAMSKAQRIRSYRIAESVPLSCRHAGHILSKLKRGSA